METDVQIVFHKLKNANIANFVLAVTFKITKSNKACNLEM